VNVGEAVRAELGNWRRQAASLLTDTATVTRGGGAPTLNTTTGILTPAAGTTVYTGLCRVRQPGGVDSEAERLFGEQQVTATRYIVDFAHDVTGVEVDDVVTVTDTADADLLGRSFRVLTVPAITYQLYKGFPCEVIE
jgi:hypothetical protein